MDRTIIVTGAGSAGGIGRAVAQRLVAGGDRVALVDIDADGAARNADGLAGLAGTARGFGCDVGSRDAVMATATKISDVFGPTWGLVNCAAGGPYGPPESFTEDEWRRGFDILVGGTLWWCQAVFPPMKERGAGRIVNFGSEVSDYPDTEISLNYVAAKGAVRSMTRGLARQWGQYGITANTMWPVAATDAQQAWAKAFPEEAHKMIENTSLGRMGTPLDDIAPVVEFLLSDAAQFITGATVPVNGGRAMT